MPENFDDVAHLIFGDGESGILLNNEHTMSLYETGIEVMRISLDGVISFPEGKPADELARQVMEILEKTIMVRGFKN